MLTYATHRMWEMSRDAYMDVNGRATHDCMDAGGRKRLELVFEQRSRSQSRGQDVRRDPYDGSKKHSSY